MREKVLIVDDIELNREILAVALGDEYEVLQASDGVQTIEILKTDSEGITVMLLDLIMPNVDGYAVLDYMREHGLLERIPVIVISAESARDVEVKCLEMGVTDFIRKPFDSVTVRRRVKNTAELFMYKNHLEDKVRLQTRELEEKNKLFQAQAEQIRETNEKIVDVLGTVVEYRNLESGEHIKRVKEFTNILAEKAAEKYPEYGLTPEKIAVIVAASPLHDIGKIAIKDSVLLKPGRLTDEEFEYMKTHTTKGCEILTQIAGTWSEEYEKISGIAAEDAPTAARISLQAADWPLEAVTILAARIEWFIDPTDWTTVNDTSRRIPGYYQILQDLGYTPADDETSHLDQLIAAITEADSDENEEDEENNQ